ncbi:MAG: CCA tRNA nucleotidyltransferase [Rickettsiales bacterium]
MFKNIKQFPDAEKIIKSITQFGGEVRFVGGCVRDALSSRKIKDIDFATTLTPEEIEIALTKAKIKHIPTGKQFGTISAIINKQAYEITTLRLDLKTDGRKAEVKYTQDWEEDALRRDFTINALSYDLEEDRIYDYFNGQQDLKNGVVRFVGDPGKRVQEDYLRIIRYYRFYGIFGRKVNTESVKACQKFSKHISSLSAERKLSEFVKFFDTDNWYKAIKTMYTDNILDDYLNSNPTASEMTITEHLHKYKLDPSPILVLYILGSSSVGALFKISRKQNLYIKHLHTCLMEKSLAERSKEMIYRFGKEVYFDALRFVAAKNKSPALYRDIYHAHSQWVIPTLPLKGADLKLIGLQEGKSMGDALKKAEKKWVSSNFSLSKKQLLNFIKKAL